MTDEIEVADDKGVRARLRGAFVVISTRAVRSRPSWILPAPRLLVVAAGLSSIVLAWVTVLPFHFPAIVPEGVEVAPLVLDAPAWFRFAVYIATGVLAAASLAAILLGRRLDGPTAHGGWPTVRAGVPAALLSIGAIIPIVGLLIVGNGVGAIAATLAALIGGVLGLVMAVRQITNAWMAVSAGIAIAVPWWLAPAISTGDAKSDPAWVAVSILLVSSVLVAGFYGLSTAAVRRAEMIRRGTQVERTRLLVTLVLLGVIAILVARLTFAKDLFSATGDAGTNVDAALWSLRGWTTWPLTVVIAATIVAFAVRSDRKPLRDSGTRRIFLILTAAFAIGVAALVVTAVDDLVARVQLRNAIDLSVVADLYSPVQVLAALSLLVFILVPHFRGTVARAVAAVGVVYLVPGTMAPILDKVWPGIPSFWATPVPVVVAITGIVAIIVAGQWFGRFGRVPRSALLRLLIYPVIVLHAATLLPAALGGGVATVIGVILIAVQFFFFLPRVAANRLRHTHVVLKASAGTLYALLGLVLATRSEAWTALATVFGMLVLAVPVMTSLVVRVARN